MGIRNVVGGSANRIVTTVIVGTAVVFIIASSYVFYGSSETVGLAPQTQGSLVARNTTIDTEILTKAYETDSDGDGLSDWEEVLWSTDPQNPDTNGNGISDKDEMFTTSELLSTTLFDSEEETSSEATSDFKNADTPLTSTEVLARELFSSYMYSLQEDGVNLTPEQQEEMVNNALKSIAPLLKPPVYELSEVQTVPATTENRVQYITTVREIIFSMTNATTDEDAAFLTIAQGTDQDKVWAIGILTNISNIYNTYTEELRSIPVPDDITEVHMRFVQSLLQYAYTIEGFTAINTDPLRTAASVNSFQNVRASLVQTVQVLKRYFAMYENDVKLLQNTN